MTADELRRHVELKRDMRELAPDLAAEMLRQLDAGAEPDYNGLWRAACWPTPGPVLFHTANAAEHDSIRRHGLLPSEPHRANYPRLGFHQPRGVYVSLEPDDRGRWSLWADWNVWAVTWTGLPIEPDEMNRGCYVITAVVTPDRLQLWSRLTAPAPF